ncbi:MAG: ABC transporter permease [Hyphomonadaceae bacterium]|nr:ABC transporter permease [Hyphomonadaceae bacterium]MBC6412956.1 ABC transporter permease [Hyphomonadaceae bacterium]
MADAPTYNIEHTDRQIKLSASGDWTVTEIARIDQKLRRDLAPLDYDTVIYDFTNMAKIDTAGAYVFARAIRCKTDGCFDYDLITTMPGHRKLITAAAEASMGQAPRDPRHWYDILIRIGEYTSGFLSEVYDTLAFLGRFLVVFVKLLLTPTRIRWKSVVFLIEDIGLNAAPIVMLLSFFVGAVIAYMAASLLASFGAQVFMVDLITVSVLREFATLITVIILAGRSDSAFTAQIGAMKMRQEIDAMTVIGLDTYETLVVPRAIACLVSAPVLAFLAMVSGIGGGLLVAWSGGSNGISPILFVTRIRDVVDPVHFFVGMIKTPVFALLIAVIGCRQGLAVTGSVDSLGSRTTSSVVQAIFAVLTTNAAFAVLFFHVGI